MKRQFTGVITAVLAVVALVAAGCGGGGKSTSTTGSSLCARALSSLRCAALSMNQRRNLMSK